MIKLSEATMRRKPTHADMWYVAAEAWNSSGLRGARWPGYILIRQHPALVRGLEALYYPEEPEEAGLLLAQINIKSPSDGKLNKLTEVLINADANKTL